MYHGVQRPDCRACCKRRANARYGIWNTRSKSVYRSGLETGVAASAPCVHRQYAISAPLDFIGLREPSTAGGFLIENRDLYGITSLYSIVQLSYHVFRKISIVWKKVLDICCRIWYSIKAVSQRQAQNRKVWFRTDWGSEKEFEKVLDKRFWFWYTK